MPAWVLGVALAAGVALALLAEVPALVGIEGRATDWLFRYGRPDPPSPSADIVHLDIDDKSLDSVGRWPWPREALADAIAVLDELGARVIALDVLFLDPQPPSWREDGTRIDHDAVLARVLAGTKAKVILAAASEDVQARPWPELRELLLRDITIDPDEIVTKLELTGARARAVRAKLREFKTSVLREVAAEGDLSVESLRRRVTPRDETLGRFPELHLIEQAVGYERARRVFMAGLAPADREHAPLRAGLQLPLAAFAEHAAAIGIVDARQDVDGQVRRLRLRWSTGNRMLVQFGLAAALAYRPDAAVPEEDVQLLSWPAFPDEGSHMHRVLSLGAVIDLARGRRDIERDAAAHSVALKELARNLPDTDGTHEGIVEQATFWELAGDQPRESLEAIQDEGERGRARVRNLMREYLKRTAELERGRKEFDRARARLRTEVADKLVFVGSNASGNFGDYYPTVLDKRMPGVRAHAMVANAVLTGYVVREKSPRLAALLAVVLGIAAAVVTTVFGPRLALLITLLIGTAFFTFNTLVVFNRQREALPMATPLLGLMLSWVGTVLLRAVQERREKWQLRRQFGARISKRLFEHLIEHPDQVHLEGEEREVTCFFSDLAGFTSISEQLDSRQTVRLLNRYMWAMNNELSELNAYVNKFLGDGIMAVWGAFRAGTPHAERACQAALACMHRLEQLNTEPEFAGLPDLSMRIGIATGVVTVGDCGAPPDLRDYTVIGDSANLAARLESASKQFGTKILINGRCKDQLPEGMFFTRSLGSITVVGQRVPSRVYELIALAGEETPAQRSRVELTHQAIEHFRQRAFGASREAWQALERTHGPSPLARLYVDAMAYAESHDDEPFDGVLHLGRK